MVQYMHTQKMVPTDQTVPIYQDVLIIRSLLKHLYFSPLCMDIMYVCYVQYTKLATVVALGVSKM